MNNTVQEIYIDLWAGKLKVYSATRLSPNTIRVRIIDSFGNYWDWQLEHSHE